MKGRKCNLGEGQGRESSVPTETTENNLEERATVGARSIAITVQLQIRGGMPYKSQRKIIPSMFLLY